MKFNSVYHFVTPASNYVSCKLIFTCPVVSFLLLLLATCWLSPKLITTSSTFKTIHIDSNTLLCIHIIEFLKTPFMTFAIPPLPLPTSQFGFILLWFSAFPFFALSPSFLTNFLSLFYIVFHLSSIVFIFLHFSIIYTSLNLLFLLFIIPIYISLKIPFLAPNASFSTPSFLSTAA